MSLLKLAYVPPAQIAPWASLRDAVAAGMLSLRKLLNYLAEDQRDNLFHLEACINVDSIGG